jgi:hypothetical protein
VQPEKKEELGELIAELLGENLRGLRAIAGLASDRTWTEKQNAADLAIFYGVLADKAVRILGALKPSEDNDTLRAIPGEARISD